MPHLGDDTSISFLLISKIEAQDQALQVCKSLRLVLLQLWKIDYGNLLALLPFLLLKNRLPLNRLNFLLLLIYRILVFQLLPRLATSS
jgi:hypothetical protein